MWAVWIIVGAIIWHLIWQFIIPYAVARVVHKRYGVKLTWRYYFLGKEDDQRGPGSNKESDGS